MSMIAPLQSMVDPNSPIGYPASTGAPVSYQNQMEAIPGYMDLNAQLAPLQAKLGALSSEEFNGPEGQALQQQLGQLQSQMSTLAQQSQPGSTAAPSPSSGVPGALSTVAGANPSVTGTTTIPGVGGQMPGYGNASPQATSAGGYDVASVGAPPTPGEYFSAVEAQYKPYFAQQQQNLEAEMAAKGLGASGAANKGMQDLTAYDNSTIAQATAPLIAQGFGQQFQANTQNAAATNTQRQIQNQNDQTTSLANTGTQESDLARREGLTNTNYQQGQSLGFQGMEANQAAALQTMLANQNAQNQFGLAGMNIAGSNYQAQIGALAQLLGIGQTGQNSIFSGGMNNQNNGYQNGYSQLLPYSAASGAASGIPNGNGTITGYQADGTPVYSQNGIPSFNGGSYTSNQDPNQYSTINSSVGTPAAPAQAITGNQLPLPTPPPPGGYTGGGPSPDY